MESVMRHLHGSIRRDDLSEESRRIATHDQAEMTPLDNYHMKAEEHFQEPMESSMVLFGEALPGRAFHFRLRSKVAKEGTDVLLSTSPLGICN